MMEWFSANAVAIQAFSAAAQAAFALALVLIGAGQWWVYHSQRRIMEGQLAAAKDAADAAKRTVDQMTDTAERQLRAHVSAEGRSLISFDAQAPIRVEVALQNAGQTPAYEMRFAGGVVIMEYPYKLGTVFNVSFEGDVSKTVLHPGREFMAQAATKQSVPDDALAAIRDGAKWRLYVGGTVAYKDAFGRERRTKFLSCTGGPSFAQALDAAGGDCRRAQIQWEHTPEHNEAN